MSTTRGFGFRIPDTEIAAFFDFLFQYNFTIEENTLYDEELELNPEFLGIIFERLVNKADGAVYTPRAEVDFMCRMALVKWLEKNSASDKRDLYYLFFREGGASAEFDEMQKQGDFSPAQIKDAVQLLEKVTVCDPAAGSGAFEVGMLHVLNDVLGSLLSRNNTPADLPRKTPFERKKEIIANSLYGVEVKRWAVWINQLRLWLTLFIDMPDEYRNSLEPLLPSLNFKVRCGDSLVQRIGSKMFPVQGHAQLPREIKRRITGLKKLKVEFFHNRGKHAKYVRDQENRLFREILDAEIAEKKTALRGIIAPQPFQSDLGFVKGPSKKDQLRLKTTEENKQRLTGEITELAEQRRNLKDDHPLIWNIEFAEIFFDGGGFDIIIGNPPYVRQEDIADPNGKLQPKNYKAALQETMRLDFPKHFKAKVKISGKSDLYTFFYLRSLHLLNSKGVHVFICSNSWLDVGYGVWMQYFLLKNVSMQFVFDNHAKRSFVSSDINTIITVFSAPAPVTRDLSRDAKNVTRLSSREPENVTQLSSCKPAQDESRVTGPKFVAFKQPFEDVILIENLLEIENAQSIVKNDAFRVYPISAEKLLLEGSEFDSEQHEQLGMSTYIGDKWGGKYLRAPDVFFTILEKAKGKLVKLKDVAKVKRGITTGANDFFYLTEEQSRHWGIEQEFLKPVIKSPRECKSILIKEKDLKYNIFMCNKSKKELKGTNALKYIEWGERAEMVIKQGKDKGKRIKGFHNLETVKNRRRWWALGELIGNTFWVKETNDRLAVFISNQDIIADCRLYYAKLPKSSHIFLNSVVYSLFSETQVRAGLGLGARSLMVFEVNSQFVLKPQLLESDFHVDGNFWSRPIHSIFTEYGIDPKSDIPISEQEPNPLPDRAALDKVVFDALDLTEEERKEVYRAVCQLVWNRISKAKSV